MELDVELLLFTDGCLGIQLPPREVVSSQSVWCITDSSQRVLFVAYCDCTVHPWRSQRNCGFRHQNVPQRAIVRISSTDRTEGRDLLTLLNVFCHRIPIRVPFHFEKETLPENAEVYYKAYLLQCSHFKIGRSFLTVMRQPLNEWEVLKSGLQFNKSNRDLTLVTK